MARISITPEQWSIARAQYEGEPLTTLGDIAKSLGVTRQAVQAHSKQNGWQKRLDLQTVIARAHEKADAEFVGEPAQSAEQAAGVVAALPKPVEPARFPRTLTLVPRGVSPEQAQAVAESAAVDLRAAVLKQHR